MDVRLEELIDNICHNITKFSFNTVSIIITRSGAVLGVIFQFRLSAGGSERDNNTIVQPECDHVAGPGHWQCGLVVRLSVVIPSGQVSDTNHLECQEFS